MTPLNSFASSLCDLRTPLPTKQPPPQQTTWNGDGDGGDENDDASVSSTTTWDSTFQYSTAATSTTTAGEGATTTTTDTVGCLCPVAVSDGLYLYGGVWQRRASDASRDPGCWWTWEQDLASSGSVAVNPSSTGIRITSMASNASGTVLAAATNAGTVSLLRAADGAILASRQVVVASNANNNNPMASVLSSPINLVWISSPNRINNDTAAADDDASFGGNENDDDILMIEIPYSDCEEEEDLDDTTDGAATVRLPHLILASSIRGPCLNAPFSNDTNAAHHKVAEAAKAMQIWGLTEEEAIVRDMKKNWMALTACRHRCSTSSSVDSTIVRLVACDRDGSLALWDCDCRQQTATLVQANLSLHYDDSTISTSNETNETRTTINDGGGDNFMIDFEVGLYTQCTTLSYGLPHSFVVCAAVVPEAPPLLLWIDPWNRKTACHMELPPDTSSASAGMWPSAAAIGSRTTTPNNNTKVLALEPVAAWNAVDAIAVAVAVKISSRDGGGSGEIFVHVLQVLVEHGGLAESDDSVRLLSPHIVYTIPICNDAMSLGLASILTGSSNIAGSTAPYSFRCQLVGTNSGSNTSYTANQKCTVSYKEFQPNPGTSSTVGQIRSLLGRNQFDAADKLLARADEQKQAWVRDSYANFVPSEIALKRLQHVVALTSDHREISNALEHAQSCLRQLASGAVTSDWGDRGICLFVDAVDLVSQSPSSLSCEQFCKGLQALVASIIFVAERVPLEQGEKLVAKKDAIANRIAALEFLASVSEHSRPTTPFHTIRSPRHLYIVLVREQNFSLAEALCRSKLRHQITPEILVAPILKINAAGNVQPQKYLSLLSNIVIPALAVNDEYFSQVKIWCCSLADDMDASNHERLSLNDAIDLLQTVDSGARELHQKIFASFGCASPFLESAGKTSVGESPTKKSPLHEGPLSSRRKVAQNFPNKYSKQPTPTILVFGGLKLEASIAHPRPSICRGETDIDQEDCINVKLQQAQCLQRAREIGLGGSVIKLRDFEQKGGFQYVAKELLRHVSSQAQTHDERLHLFNNVISGFCQEFHSCKDQAVLDLTKDMARCKDTGRSTEESCSIVRCCSSVIVRCRAALIVLRAALIRTCTHYSLVDLANDAVAWASFDSAIQSEVNEASRSLHIDRVLLKYCGPGAREMFRVDNPRHGIRLLEHVINQVNYETSLPDILSLCEGFHHLCPHKAVRMLLENSLSEKDDDVCLELWQQLFRKDGALAEKVLVDMIAFAEEILEECSHGTISGYNCGKIDRSQERARNVTSRVGALIQCAMEHSVKISAGNHFVAACFLRESSIQYLHTVFLSLNRLQNDYSVFVSLNELFQVQTTVDKATQLIESIVVDKTNLTTTMLAEARRVVSLLTIISKADVVDVWVAAASRIAVSLVHENRDGNLLEFLSKVGLLTSADNEHSSQAIVSIAIALCSQSSSAGLDSSTRMKRCMTSVALVQDWSMLISHGKLLSEVVGFSSLLDVAYHSFTRCDEGAGESMESLRRSLQSLAWPILSTSSPTIHQLKGTFIVPMHKPTLHSSWYIGDGLLLPPEEALPTCVGLCTDLLRKCVSADRNTTDLYKLVSGRGAHSFALRVLCHASVVLACHGLQQDCDSRYPDLKLALAHTSRALAERCLGGTGSGITSSLIDSQKAVSFLLALPIKEAFALYKSSIPTAVKTNNFARLHTLSSVGMVSGSSDSKLGTCAIFSIGWKRQQKFYEQCAQLCARAKWWTVLKGHDIEFDSQRFYDRKEEKGTGGSFDDYAAYLLPMILAKMSQILSSFQVVRLTSLYTETFHLPRDLVIEQHISFLLSPSRSKLINGKIGCSFDSDRYEKSVRDSLQLLHPRLKRVATLKRCLDTLDEADISGQDYDMYSLVLRLYFDELVLAIDQGQGPINSFEADLEWIERRRDVLNILSAYFQGDRLGKRPCFAKFFLPLHDRRVLCGILGSFSDCVNEPMFDPLEPLQSVLATSHDVTLVTALSPLCIPLGLPQGYIHVRSLMARFRRAHENDIDYPSYENEVGPVMKRITSSNDRAQLANWCSNQYVDNDVEKLKCLEVALQSTIKASSEVERRRQVNPHDSDLEKKELAALDGLKLISLRKESLASILQVKHLLKSSVTSKSLSIKDFSDCLINELSRCAIETPELSPETLIDLLYYQGSLLASQRCLDKNGCLSINIFRQICEIVHAACSSVADQNSHIDIGAQARRMAHRWLFYGDVDGTANCNETKAVAEAAQQPSIVYDDDDTLDFVMDLIEVQESHEIALGPIETTREDCLPREQQVIAAEEGSAFRCESKRELSDCNDQRTSLRIAFVLAFARQHPSEPDEIYAKENFDKNKADSIDIVRKRRGVLTQLKLKRDSIQENNILNQSSTLLGIVFARLDSTSHTIARLRTASLDSSIEYKRKEIPKTITFAMRHRALQTAAILCPQESLEEVIRDEGYLQSTTGSLKNCSLRQCTFGVFVAKEIEEMGLPLPHSNLVQLSSMHFLSYARTLWRHHRDNHALCRSKGRLLLLLVEMSLQEQDTDVSFITNLIDAMIQFNLPRTLILSLERITEHQKRAGPTHWLDRQSTSKAITAVTSHMVLELQQLAAPTTTIDKSLASKVSSMLDRVINIAQDLLDNEEVRRQLEVLDVVVSNIRKSKTRFISDKLKSKLTDLIDNDTIPVN